MRDLTQCHPKLQVLANELVTACERKGLPIRITECLRTVQEQDALYAQGRTKPGNRVTNARGSSYSSMHQWGVAFDFCRNDRKAAFDDSDGFFSKVGQIGKTLGLEWGGDWVSIKDKPHFQLPDWGSTTARLKQLYGNPERFKATWQAAQPKPQTAVDPDTAKYGAKLPKKKYEVMKACYVRSKPGMGDETKVKFSKLDDVTKAKCVKGKDGYAKWLAGKRFDRVRQYVGSKGNTWYQTAKGWWLPTIVNGEKKVKAMN